MNKLLLMLSCCVVPRYVTAGMNADSLRLQAEKYKQAGDIAQLAATEFQLGKYHYRNEEDSLATLHLNAAIGHYTGLGDGKGLATCYNLFGNLLSDLGKNEEAVSRYQAALNALSKSNNDTLRSQINNNMGLVYKDLGKYEESLRLLFETLKLKEKIHASSRSISSTLLNIGLVFDILARYDYALKYYHLSLDLKMKDNDSLGISRILSNIATTCKNKGDLEKGIEMIEMSNRYNEHIGNKEQKYINATNLGNIRKLQGKPEEAMEQLLLALSYAEELKNITYLSDIHQNLGSLYADTHRYAESILHYTRALEYAVETNSPAQLQEVHEKLSLSCSELNRYEDAYQHLSASNRYRDEVYSLEGRKAIEELKVQYETEKKEKKIAQQDADLAHQKIRTGRQQNLLVYSLLGIVGLISLATVFIWRQRTRNRALRQQALLDLQNERVRISRDLHDNIGADLTLISSALGSRSFRSSGIEKAELNVIQGYAESAMQQLRETVWAMRNESVSLAELQSRVSQYGSKMAGSKGLQFSAVSAVKTDVQLSPVQTLHLYRVCQEAIHNAAKYSGGTLIRLSTTFTPPSLCFTISDDGAGINPDQYTNGHGIQNMQERIRELHGEFSIASGAGTEITFRIPVQ